MPSSHSPPKIDHLLTVKVPEKLASMPKRRSQHPDVLSPMVILKCRSGTARPAGARHHTKPNDIPAKSKVSTSDSHQSNRTGQLYEKPVIRPHAEDINWSE